MFILVSCFYYLILRIMCFCIVSSFVLFPIFVQDYPPLPPGGNPIAVNKYRRHHHDHHQNSISS